MTKSRGTAYGTITLGTTSAPLGATTTAISGLTLNSSLLSSAQEKTTISATAATGTIQFDVKTQSILYYTAAATGNFVLNFRGDSVTSLDSLMATQNVITLVFLNTNTGTAFYPTSITIDGGAVTPKVQNGVAITSGNINSIDSYSVVILKTATGTFTVLESQTKFA